MNRCVLIGRIGKDPELRTTQTGKDVVEFSIAVAKKFRPAEGEPDADWFRIKAWGHTAKYVSEYLSKGRLVAVDGRIETRKYTDSNGSNREIFEIVAENVQALDKPRDDAPAARSEARSSAPARQAPARQTPAQDEYDPFADE